MEATAPPKSSEFWSLQGAFDLLQAGFHSGVQTNGSEEFSSRALKRLKLVLGPKVAAVGWLPKASPRSREVEVDPAPPPPPHGFGFAGPRKVCLSLIFHIPAQQIDFDRLSDVLVGSEWPIYCVARAGSVAWERGQINWTRLQSSCSVAGGCLGFAALGAGCVGVLLFSRG